jgi:hypothetical protein
MADATPNPLRVLAEHAAAWRDRMPDDALAHHARRALVDGTASHTVEFDDIYR